jgi:hypothetical protein
MLEWAKREVEIASKRERGDKPESEWDYGCACYAGALEAFEVLCKQGHSGMSIGITKQILNRLIEGKPLTPIEDTEDVWNGIIDRREDFTCYQCGRMSSLFKYVYDDGRVTYSDNERIVCVDIHSGSTYYSGLVRGVVNEMYPLTMPYMPKAPYKVYCEDYLTDPKNGDFDTVGIRYLLTPEGERVTVEKFYKESGKGFAEISLDEYLERVELDKARQENLK